MIWHFKFQFLCVRLPPLQVRARSGRHGGHTQPYKVSQRNCCRREPALQFRLTCFPSFAQHEHAQVLMSLSEAVFILMP